MTIKVFQMNDYEWVAAETLESAKKWLCEHYGMDEEEACDDPRELSETEMETIEFCDYDPDDAPDEGYTEEFKKAHTHTFKVELANRIAKGTEFPEIFASHDN